jgi:hypothetical protein
MKYAGYTGRAFKLKVFRYFFHFSVSIFTVCVIQPFEHPVGWRWGMFIRQSIVCFGEARHIQDGFAETVVNPCDRPQQWPPC